MTKQDKLYLLAISGLWLVLSMIWRHAYYYNVDEFTYHTAIIAGQYNSGLILGRPLFIFINHSAWQLLALFSVSKLDSFFYLSALQQLLSLGAIIFFFLWIKELWHSRRLAGWAALMAATNFGLLFFGGSLLSEPLMHFWLFSSLYYSAKYLNEGHKNYLYLASLLLGLGVLSKETIIILIPIFVVQFWVNGKNSINTSTMIKSGLIFLATCLAGVIGLLIYYQTDYLISFQTSWANNIPLYHNLSLGLLKQKIITSWQILQEGLTPIYLLTGLIGIITAWRHKKYDLLLLVGGLLTQILVVFVFGIPQGRLFATSYFGVALVSAYALDNLWTNYRPTIASIFIALMVILALIISYTNFKKIDHYLHWRQNYAQTIKLTEQAQHQRQPIFMIGRQNYIFNGPMNNDGKFKVITTGSAWDNIPLDEQIGQALKNGNIIIYDATQYPAADQKIIGELVKSRPQEILNNFIIISP